MPLISILEIRAKAINSRIRSPAARLRDSRIVEEEVTERNVRLRVCEVRQAEHTQPESR